MKNRKSNKFTEMMLKKKDHLVVTLKNNILVFVWWLIYTALAVVVPCVLFCRAFGFVEMKTGYKVLFGAVIAIIVIIIYLGKTINEQIARVQNGLRRTVFKTVKTLIPLVLLYVVLEFLSGTVADLRVIVLYTIWLNVAAAIPMYIVEENYKTATADELLYQQDMANLRREERFEKREKKRAEKEAKRANREEWEE